jgi:hypothetical protein
MTHEEFVAAYQAGKLTVQIGPKAAARLVSSRMMRSLRLALLMILSEPLALLQIVGGQWC